MYIPEHLINDEPQVIGQHGITSIGPPITEEDRREAINRREESLAEFPDFDELGDAYHTALDADRGPSDAERRRRYNSGSFMPISAREWRERGL